MKNCLTISSVEVEGFGSNFIFLLTTYALARRFGCYYTHTPLKNIVYSTSAQYGYDEQGDKELNDYVTNCLFPSAHMVSIHGNVRYINNISSNTFPAEPVGPMGGEHIVHCPPPINTENSIDGSDIEYINAPAHIEEIRKILYRPLRKNRVVRIYGDFGNHCHLSFSFDKDPSLMINIRDELMENYRKCPHTPPTYFHKDEINIAIHTRRFCSPPDNQGCNHPNYWLFFSPGSTIDLFYRSLVSELSTKLSGRAACFHFYGHAKNASESSEYDHFTNYLNDKKHRIEVHINERPSVSFHHMILADILFVPKSAFSYCASLFSRGPVLVRKGFLDTFTWCKNLLPHVYTVELDGTFDETIIAKVLANKGL